MASQNGNNEKKKLHRPDQCNAYQIETISYQLPAEDCARTKRRPWQQKCSFSYATRCPDAVWLDEFYESNSAKEPFLGVYVGCNKGMDAVNALRMGSGDPSFDKFQWRDELLSKTADFLPGVCDQDSTPQFPLYKEDWKSHSGEPAEMHCIEPMPVTAKELLRSSRILGWHKRGFVVSHAAISNEDGTARFPSAPIERGDHAAVKMGTENKGLSSCDKVSETDSRCEDVRMYKLDTYAEKFVKSKGPINVLSIDVEGHDFDVILGAKSQVLARVQYLEFEYNWMGSWKRQSLKYAINFLDSEFGFTCYWPGTQGNIWRITGCWLEHYDLHFWSNVACVNRNFEQVRSMAEKMEILFLRTLEKGQDIQMTGSSSPN